MWTKYEKKRGSGRAAITEPRVYRSRGATSYVAMPAHLLNGADRVNIYTNGGTAIALSGEKDGTYRVAPSSTTGSTVKVTIPRSLAVNFRYDRNDVRWDNKDGMIVLYYPE